MAGIPVSEAELDEIERDLANQGYAELAAADTEDKGQLRANFDSWASGVARPIMSMGARALGSVDGQDADTINRINAATQGAMGEKDKQLAAKLFGPSEKEIKEAFDSGKEWPKASFMQRNFPAIVGGVRGAATTLPSMVAAGAVGGLPGVIGAASAMSGNEAITSGRDAGLEGGELAGHVGRTMAVEASVTALFGAAGGGKFGGAEKMVADAFKKGGASAAKKEAAKFMTKDAAKEILTKAGIPVTSELAEEYTIGFLNAAEQQFSGVDPNATTPEAIKRMLVDTTVQTAAMMGMMGAGNQIANRLKPQGESQPQPLPSMEEATAATTPTPDQTGPQPVTEEELAQELPPVMDVLTGAFSDGKPKTVGEIELALQDAGYDIDDPDVQADANAAVDELLRKGYVADGSTGLISAPGNLTQDRNQDGMRKLLLDNGVSPDVVNGLDPEGLATMTAVIEQQIERSLGVVPQTDAEASTKGGDQNEEGNQEGRQGGQGLLEPESTEAQTGATTAGETSPSTPVQPTETKIDEEEYLDGQSAQTEPPVSTSPAPVETAPETQTDAIGTVSPGDLPAAENIESKPRPKYDTEFPGEANTRAAVWTADDGRIAAGLIDDDADENLPITFFTPNDDRPGYARILAEGYAEGLVKRGDVKAAAAFAKRATRGEIVPLSRAASYYGVERDAIEQELRPKVKSEPDQTGVGGGLVAKAAQKMWDQEDFVRPIDPTTLAKKAGRSLFLIDKESGAQAIASFSSNPEGVVLATQGREYTPKEIAMNERLIESLFEQGVGSVYVDVPQASTPQLMGSLSAKGYPITLNDKKGFKYRIDPKPVKAESSTGIIEQPKPKKGPVTKKPKPAPEATQEPIDEPTPKYKSGEVISFRDRDGNVRTGEVRNDFFEGDDKTVSVRTRPMTGGYPIAKVEEINPASIVTETPDTTGPTPVISDQAPVVSDEKPIERSVNFANNMADVYEREARKSEGGTGVSVGAGNIDSRWKADYLRSYARKVSGGMDPVAAGDQVKADARKVIAAHNNRRSDSNWQRWEGTVDSVIDNAVRMATAKPKQEASVVEQSKPLTDEELSQRVLDAMMGGDVAPAQEPTPEPVPAPVAKKGLKKKIVEKKDAAAQDYEDKRGKAINALNKLRKNPSASSGVPLTPEAVEALRAVADMMVAGVRHKAWSFAEIVADIADQAGNAFVTEFRPFLERGWKAVQAVEKVDAPDYDQVFAQYETVEGQADDATQETVQQDAERGPDDGTRTDDPESLESGTPKNRKRTRKGGTTRKRTKRDKPSGASDGGEATGVGSEPVGDSGTSGSGVHSSSGGVKYQFKINTDNTEWFEGGAVTKLNRNIEAIRALKIAEEQGRLANPQEQDAIAKFTGWGHLKQFFVRARTMRQIGAIDLAANTWNEAGLAKLDAFSEKEIRNRHKDESAEYIDNKIAREKNLNRHRIRLAQSMTPTEYEAARSSIRFSHYSDPRITSAIWKAIERVVGSNRTRFLEPSEGSGIFLGTMPDGMRETTEIVGIDKDRSSSRVARHMYQQARHLNVGFEEIAYPDDYFDSTATNVPFHQNPVTDASDKSISGKLSLHNYFFAKAGKKLRPGGVLAFITTHFTMDAIDPGQRKLIAEQGLSFVGALRLPSTAFGDIANTEVVTDIILMQKVLPGQKPVPIPNPEKRILFKTDRQTGTRTQVEISVSTYYQGREPENVIGKLTAEGTMRSRGENEGELTVDAQGRSMAEIVAKIDERLADMPFDKEAFEAGASLRKDQVESEKGSVLPIPDHLSHLDIGRLEIDGENLVVRLTEDTVRVVSPKYSQTKQDRARAWFKVRDAWDVLRNAQADERYSDSEVESLRKLLNEVYDDFVKKYDSLNSTYNKSQFGDDWQSDIVLALENVKREPTGEVTKTGKPSLKLVAEKADVFTKRTQTPGKKREAPTTFDGALAQSFFTNGRVDLEWIANAMKVTKEEAVTKLQDKIIKTPSGSYELIEMYLSGNIVAKIADAERAAQDDAAFLENVAKLNAVLPTPKTFDQIKAVVNSSFMPVDLLKQFIGQTFGANAFDLLRNPQDAGGGFTFNYLSPFASKAEMRGNRSTENIVEYAVRDASGNVRRTGLDLINDMLAGKGTVIMRPDPMNDDRSIPDEALTAIARAKRKQIERAFEAFFDASPNRKQAVEKEFNDSLNGYVKFSMPDWVLSFEGMADHWLELMREYQKQVIGKIALGGNTLVAHKVGYGKTLSGVAGMMEQKRLGVANKPTAAVPKHLFAQWVQSFATYYPKAKVYAPDVSDFDKANRQATLNRIRTGNWDAVIIPNTVLKKMPMSPEYTREFYGRELEAIEELIERMRADENKDPRSLADVEAMRDAIVNRMNRYLNAAQKDSGPFFDELGIDSLTIDEAHHYKNLPFYTRNTRVAGINPSGSQQAFDLLMKADFINELSNDRNLTFLTGTPIANSMTEAWVMMRYLMPNTLKQAGVFAFDDWKNSFGEVISMLRVNTVGTGYRNEERFQQFVNTDTLFSLFSQVADVKMKSTDVSVPPLRGGKPTAVVVPSSGAMKNLMLGLAKRAASMPDDPSEDNILVVMNHGAASSIDMRMLGGVMPPDSKSKVGVAADQVFDIYKSSTPFKGTQLVWSDRGVPKKAKKLTANMKELGEWMIDQAESGDIQMDVLIDKWKEIDSSSKSMDNLRRFMSMASQDFNFEPGDESDENVLKIEIEDEVVYISSITSVDPEITTENPPPWNVYKEMKDQLVAKGIPANEIAFIHDYETTAAKLQLFQKMNDGEVRVLVGNTPRLGTGANIQRRLIATHHLDVPYRPADVEQRDGRILRSGNKVMDLAAEAGIELEGVEIFRYVTEGSIDSRYWQIQEDKGQMLLDFFDGAAGEVGDLSQSSLSAAEMKSEAVANPLLKRRIELEKKVSDLREEYTAARSSRSGMEAAIESSDDRVKSSERSLAYAKEVDAWYSEFLKTLPEDETAAVEIDGVTHYKKDDIGSALAKKFNELAAKIESRDLGDDPSDWAKDNSVNSSQAVKIGSIGGKDLMAGVSPGFYDATTETIIPDNSYQRKLFEREINAGKWQRTYFNASIAVTGISGLVNMGRAEGGYKQRIVNFLQGQSGQVESNQRALDESKSDLRERKALLGRTPIPDQSKLQETEQELEQVTAQLGSASDDVVDSWVATQEFLDVFSPKTAFGERMLGIEAEETYLGFVNHPTHGKIRVFNRAHKTRPPKFNMVYLEAANKDAAFKSDYYLRDDAGVLNLKIKKESIEELAKRGGTPQTRLRSEQWERLGIGGNAKGLKRTGSSRSPVDQLGTRSERSSRRSKGFRRNRQVDPETGRPGDGEARRQYASLPTPALAITTASKLGLFANRPAASKARTKEGGKLLEAIRADAKNGTRQVGKRSIGEFLNRAFSGQLIVTNSQTSKRNPAVFMSVGATTFTRSGTWDVNIHEAGHAMDAMLTDANPDWYAQHEQEITQFAMSDLAPHASAPTVAEGIAELVRLYVTGQQLDLPLMKSFTDMLENVSPEAMGALTDAQAAYAFHESRPYEDKRAADRNDRAIAPSVSPAVIADSFWGTMNQVVGNSVLIHRMRRKLWKSITGESALSMLDPTGVIGSVNLFLQKQSREAKKVAKAVMASIVDTTADVSRAYQRKLGAEAVKLQAMQGSGLSIYINGNGLKGLSKSDVKALRDVGFPLPDKFAGDGELQKITDKSFEQIKEAVGKDWQDFETAVFDRVALERYRKAGHAYPGMLDGRTPKVLQEESEKAFREHPEWEKHFKDLERFMGQTLLVGMLGGQHTVQEVINIFTAWEDYAPLQRQVENRTSGKGSSKTDPDFGVKKAKKGSYLEFRALEDSVRDRVSKAVSAYHDNNLIKAVRDQSRAIGSDTRIAYEVRKDIERTMIPLRMDSKIKAVIGEEMQADIIAAAVNRIELQKLGIDTDGMTDSEVMELIYAEGGQAWTPDDIQVALPGLPLRVIRGKKRPDLPRVVGLWENGVRKYYYVSDPLMFSMFANSGEVNQVVSATNRLLGGLTEPWKRAYTHSFKFLVRSLLRDPVTAAFLSEHKTEMIPGWYIGSAVIGRITGNEFSKEARTGAELMTKALDATTHHDHQSFLEQFKSVLTEGIAIKGYYEMPMTEKLMSAPGQAMSVLLKPVDVFNYLIGTRWLSQQAESLGREGAYIAERKRGFTPSKAQERYEKSAGNFGQRQANKAVAGFVRTAGFLNPSLQILWQTYEAMTDPNPSRRMVLNGTRAAYIAAVGASAAAINIAILHAYFDDDEEKLEEVLNNMRERDEKEKLSNAAVLGCFRMPFDYGVAGSIMSAAWNATEEALLGVKVDREKRALEMAERAASLPGFDDLIPPFPKTLLEQVRNKSFYTDRDIVPDRMLSMYADNPQLQYHWDTPDLYKDIGSFVGVSPLRVEHAVRGLTTSIYDDAIKFVDKQQRGLATVRDIPLWRGLTTWEATGRYSRSVRSLDDLNREYMALDQKITEDSRISPEAKAEYADRREALALAHGTMNAINDLMDANRKERDKETPNYDKIKANEAKMTQLAADFINSDKVDTNLLREQYDDELKKIVPYQPEGKKYFKPGYRAPSEPKKPTVSKSTAKGKREWEKYEKAVESYPDRVEKFEDAQQRAREFVNQFNKRRLGNSGNVDVRRQVEATLRTMEAPKAPPLRFAGSKYKTEAEWRKAHDEYRANRESYIKARREAVELLRSL